MARKSTRSVRELAAVSDTTDLSPRGRSVRRQPSGGLAGQPTRDPRLVRPDLAAGHERARAAAVERHRVAAGSEAGDPHRSAPSAGDLQRVAACGVCRTSGAALPSSERIEISTARNGGTVIVGGVSRPLGATTNEAGTRTACSPPPPAVADGWVSRLASCVVAGGVVVGAVPGCVASAGGAVASGALAVGFVRCPARWSRRRSRPSPARSAPPARQASREAHEHEPTRPSRPSRSR